VDPGAVHRPHADQSRLRELQAGTTIVAALAFYDRLEPVDVEEMIGSWRGEGLPTGNPRALLGPEPMPSRTRLHEPAVPRPRQPA
jgi:hypothetical protein